MPLPFMAIGAGLGALGSLGKMIFGSKQNKLANKIKPVWSQYQTSPYAKEQLGIAKQLFSGRMAGAPQMERNILANQANFMGNVSRNATDGSQALALAAAGQGQTNQAFSDLMLKESQNKYGMLGNLNQAYGTMIGEGNKVHQSLMDKFQMDVNQKNALRESGASNIFGGLNDLSSLGIMLGQNQRTKQYGQSMSGRLI